MNKANVCKITFLLAGLALAFGFFAPQDAFAQCAMCKASAANLDSVSARNLNISTLILLCPPVAIFCAIFVIAYKHRNAPDNDGDDS